MLRAGVMTDGGVSRSDAGTPQGGVLSPCLANVYLHRLDRQWADRGTGVLVRYADDLLAMCQTRQEAERALSALTAILAELGLELKQAKTRIVHLHEGGEGVDFLGFHTAGCAATRRARGNCGSSPAGPHGRPGSMPATGSGDHRPAQAAGTRRGGRAGPQPVPARLVGLLPLWKLCPTVREDRPLRQDRIARFVAKRHKRGWGYGMKVVAYQSPNRLGLISLNGTIVAPRPNRPWRPGR